VARQAARYHLMTLQERQTPLDAIDVDAEELRQLALAELMIPARHHRQHERAGDAEIQEASR
jgi:hypothetical protein